MTRNDYTVTGDRDSDAEVSIPAVLYDILENYAENKGVTAREVLIGIILAWTDV